MLDEARVRADAKESLLQELRETAPSGLSDKLIAMSDTLQQCRLAVQKAERRAEELDERERHVATLLSKRTKKVGELEVALASMERDLHVKEERWRLADNDRLRIYFD